MKKSRVLPIALLALVSIGAITVEKSISSRITTRVYEVMPRATDVTASVPLFDLPGNVVGDSIKSVHIDIGEYQLKESTFKPSLAIDARDISKSKPNLIGTLDVTATISAATAMLASRLRDWKLQHPASRIHACFAMMVDKDRPGSLQHLLAFIDDWYIADLSFMPRAATLQQLSDNLASFERAAIASGKVSECLPLMINNSNPDDLLLVFGSFYTVADAMKFLDISLIDYKS